MKKPAIGVMGGASGDLKIDDSSRFEILAEQLGWAIAAQGCSLITGATTGVPYMVSKAAKSAGGLTIGISPAANCDEHARRYNLPVDASSVIVYTGFGLKGRNVININSSDIVIIFGGSVGTLNEFTIAYDQGKIIGVLSGTGGVADNVEEVVRFCSKPSRARLLFDDDPESLVKGCIDVWNVEGDPES